MPNPVRKILFVGSFSLFIGLYLLSKYLPRENLLGKFCLTPRVSFVADHHSSRSNERYRSVLRLYTLSFGIISYFHPNFMKIPLVISRRFHGPLGLALHFSILCTGVGVAPVMWPRSCMIVKSAETALFNGFFDYLNSRWAVFYINVIYHTSK